MTTLLLIRHGESQANLDEVWAGAEFDSPLTETGRKQALKTAEYVFENFKVDKVYSSDLMRAYNTGKPIADKFSIPIVADEELREIYSGDWERVGFDELKKNYAKSFEVWHKDIGHAQPDNGEKVSELQKRFCDEVEKIAKENDGKTVVITTHSTPIRAFQCKYRKNSLDEMKDIPWVSNASVTVVEYRDGKYTFKAIGVDDFMGEIRTSLPDKV